MATNRQPHRKGEEQQHGDIFTILQPHIEKLEQHRTKLGNAKTRSLLTPTLIEKQRDEIDKINEKLDTLRKNTPIEFKELIADVRKKIDIACDELSQAVEEHEKNRTKYYEHMRNALDSLEKATDIYYNYGVNEPNG